MLLKKHRCTLNLGSYSMLPKKPNAGFWALQCRKFRKVTLVSYNHPCAFRYYKSFPAVVADRQRQILEGGWYLFHPISKFSLFWESLMIIVNLSHMVVSPLRLCFVLEPPGFKDIHTIDEVLLGLHVICLMDILVGINTGYFTGEIKQSVMDRSRIVWHYLRGFLLLDLISCLPIAYVLLVYREEDTHWLLAAHLLPLLRFARIFTVMWNMKHFIKLCTRSYLFSSFIRHTVLFALITHWFTCMIYLGPVLKSYINDEEARGFNFFLKTRGLALYKFSIEVRYLKSLFICVSAFFGTGYSLFSVWEADEILMSSVIILLGSAFMMYIVVYTLRMYMTSYNSSIRYNELMDQLEKYMRHKQFPESLKTRVLQLYNYRFQGQYFKEAEALSCLSDQLHQEISFYTCHKLVDKVKLFEGLTATLVGTILGCLKPEIYLRNDLLVRAGDIGTCMYFIASGTVQVLSLKGAEVCHLMDGAHFGEVALLMRDSKRVATIIALETTLVYRLDVQEFQCFVVTDSDLFSRIEELASRRMHETVLLDEEFRREREVQTNTDKSPNTSRYAI